MSAYTSPYVVPMHPPRGDWLAPGDTLLAPARRASTLMLVLGVLAAIATLMTISAAFMPVEELLHRSNFDVRQLQTGELTPAQYLRLMLVLSAIFLTGVSAMMLLMGGLVRRGGLASAVVAIVLVGLLSLLVGGMEIVQFLQAALAPNDYAVGSVLFFGLILTALGLLIAWLAAAIKAAGPLQRTRRVQAEQWYAMQHHPAWTLSSPSVGSAHSGGGVEPGSR